LESCKGNCCVEGKSGAPLEASETQTLEKIFHQVKSFMTPEGIYAIKKSGTSIQKKDGTNATPLINDHGQCAYVFFNDGIARCAIEKAFEEGKTDFRKPISCHLYPVRISHYQNFDALNYDRWNICSPACSLGKKLGVSVAEFVKDGLIRKYGSEWYAQLEGVARFKLTQAS
jgi:hypothetical protein